MHEDVNDVYDEVEASKFNAAVGGGSAKSAGINQSRILMSLDGFDKANKLLDYGCGIGRTMPALSTLIRKDVIIDGCDISSDFIAECRRLYRNYNFTFYKIASRNEHYDKFGTSDVSENMPSNFYDYAYSFSVFTHLSLAMVSEALKGVYDRLTTGGLYYFTMFRIDESSFDVIDTNRSPVFSFQNKISIDDIEFFATDSDRLAFVALSKPQIEAHIRSAGFAIKSFWAGSWRGISHANNVHDAYLIEKI